LKNGVKAKEHEKLDEASIDRVISLLNASHINMVQLGETHDPGTGLHHYAHAICNLLFLLEIELEKGR